MRLPIIVTLELGLLNGLNYFIQTWDIRAVAQANYLWTAIVQVVIATLTFVLFSKLQAAPKDWTNWLSYTVLGTAGTLLALLTSSMILSH